jgi:hypothetical protein
MWSFGGMDLLVSSKSTSTPVWLAGIKILRFYARKSSIAAAMLGYLDRHFWSLGCPGLSHKEREAQARQ